ncbi:MAG: S8 family peptidase [Gaiellaceae bacterium]
MTRSLLISCALLALLAVPAQAALEAPPMTLPGDAHAARAPADPGTWIVAARDAAAAAPIARRYGAERVGSVGAHVVARRDARAFAAALRRRGLLSFAEPNFLSRQRESGTDPFTSSARWRPIVVEDGLEPPAVVGGSPKLALIDSKLDITHPEFEGSRITTVGSRPVQDEHGTATAAVAAAPTNGRGIEGVWPGMIATNFDTNLSCGDIVHRIKAVVERGYDVLNMSYGAAEECFAESAELQRATAAGVLLVAAAGNEFAEGNPLEYPASLPHVVTVAAVDLNGETSYFSNANAAVDVAAPGERVWTAVPLAYDDFDRSRDGYTMVDGTSFASPIVAGVASWVAADRPHLTVDQLANVVKLSAIDLDEDGWDPNTGYGLVQVGNALRMQAPRNDPYEPNENIFWVNGDILRHRAPRVFDGRPRHSRVRARLDQFEDPADVYRVRFPGHSKTRITVNPSFGDTDVAVYRGSADSTSAPPVGLSQRPGGARERIVIQNAGRRRRAAFVEIYIDPVARGLDAGYALKFKRIR